MVVAVVTSAKKRLPTNSVHDNISIGLQCCSRLLSFESHTEQPTRNVTEQAGLLQLELFCGAKSNTH